MNTIRSLAKYLGTQFGYWKEIFVFPPLSILFVVLGYWLVPLLTGRRAQDDPASIVGDCLTLAGLMIRVAAAGLIMSHIIGYKCEKLPPVVTTADRFYHVCYSIIDSLCVLFVLWLVLHYRLG